jgi:DNA-binding HxlR family transcriptional regulator
MDKHTYPVPMTEVIARIGDKWVVLVVGGTSQRMLTVALKNLEQDGLVTRTEYPLFLAAR